MKNDNLLLILFLIPLALSKTIYLSSVFRHGARYPLNDLYDGKQTRLFHGNLTSIGLREHYLLGSYVLDEYSTKGTLFNVTFNPRQVEIFAINDAERCIQSAYAHALGLFQFYQGPKIDQSIDKNLLQPPFQTLFPSNLKKSQVQDDSFALEKGFQPVPIRYAQQFFPDCPNAGAIFTRQGKRIQKRILQLQEQFALFTQRMTVMFELPMSQISVLGLMDLYDTIVSDLYLGRKLPARFTDEDFNKLQYVQRYIFALLYEGQPASIFNQPFLTVVLDNMEKARNGNLGQKKISLYSVHDANVVPLLLFLNFTSAQCLKKLYKNETIKGNCAIPIPFASSILFQLNQSDKNEEVISYTVKVRYNGVYYNLCERQSQQCEFEEFARRCKAGLKDFGKQCQKDGQQIEEIKGIGLKIVESDI